MKTFILAAVAACNTCGAVFAQTYPTQPIKMIVPFTAGTGMDTIARAVSPRLSEKLGQPVVVQNVPGASGNIGADQVAKAAADGHTVLMGANTMLMASQMYKSVPYDPVKDFAPVTIAAWGTLMLVAHPSANIASIAQLIERAKAKPNEVSYGSPGVGTPHHMAMERFRTEAKLNLLHAPYKGSAQYIQDLLGGQLMIGFLPIHIAQGHVKAGKLIPLAVGSPKRHASAPQVLTFNELGVKGVEADLWYAFFTPAKTSAAINAKLNAEISAILKLPEVRELFSKAGMDAATSTPEELNALVAKDFPRWGRVIRTNNITAE
jgi:tripartite-type tricarboxylate transporter receptor subunit TctC